MNDKPGAFNGPSAGADVQKCGRPEIKNRALTDYAINLLNSVNHELRTPLSAITGYLYFLEGSGLSPKQEKFLELTKNAAEKIERITSSISDFCEFCQGDVKMRSSKVKISNILRQIKRNFSDIAGEYNCEFICDIKSGIERVLFCGDEYHIRQVISHLIQAALFHADSGSAVVLTAIERENFETSSLWHFDISYKGTPIRAEAVNVIAGGQISGAAFDEYIFGFMFVKKLIDAAGGKIELLADRQSYVIRVKLNLPLFDETSNGQLLSNNSAEAFKQSSAQTAARFKNDILDILLVEDNFIGRRLIGNIIENIGWKIDIACDAMEGLKFFENKKYDLILLDIQLPCMDGYEFTRIVRDRELVSAIKPTPIIAVTAYSLPADREKCMASGMDGYISKPINMDNFYKTINEVLKTYYIDNSN